MHPDHMDLEVPSAQVLRKAFNLTPGGYVTTRCAMMHFVAANPQLAIHFHFMEAGLRVKG